MSHNKRAVFGSKAREKHKAHLDAYMEVLSDGEWHSNWDFKGLLKVCPEHRHDRFHINLALRTLEHDGCVEVRAEGTKRQMWRIINKED